MSSLDWFENDPRLTGREKAEMRERKYRAEIERRAYEYEVEKRRRQMQDQMQMQMLSPFVTQTATEAAGKSLTLRGIQDAVEKLKEPEEKTSDFFNKAYMGLVENMYDSIGWSGYRETKIDREREVPKASWISEFKAKIFNGDPAEQIPEPPEEDNRTVFAKNDGWYSYNGKEHVAIDWGREENKEVPDSKAHALFWQSYRRTGKLPFTATHHG